MARIAPGLQISSRFSNSVFLTLRSSAIASTAMSTRGEVVERGAAGEPAEHLVLGALLELAALDRLVERALDRRPHPVDLVLGPADVDDVVPGLGEDLDDAGGHRAGADDADDVDVVLELGLVVGRRRLVIGYDDRAVRALVAVEAAAGLAPEHAGGDHLLEDRRRGVQAVAALAVHRLEDLVGGVEADQVEQRQRTHRVAAAVAHRGVDVLARGVAVLVHRHGVVEVAEEQRVGDEAGLVAAHDGVLAEGLDQRRDVLEHLGLGDDRLHDLDEALHRRRVEEVHADDAAGVGVGGRDLGDRQRGGVGGAGWCPRGRCPRAP